MKTSSMVPGHIVMSVFRTNRVLNVIRLRAPMLRDVVSLKHTIRLRTSRLRDVVSLKHMIRLRAPMLRDVVCR